MRSHSRLSLLVVFGLLAALGMFWGCHDEDCPTCPGTKLIISLNTIWPNADGNMWDYDYTWRVWDQDAIAYDNEIDVPPAPTLDEAIALLGVQPIGSSPTSMELRYRLRFDSLMTTESGVIAQNLEEIIYEPTYSAAPVQPLGGEEAILMRILSARPDLADKIVPMLERSPKTLPAPVAAYLSDLLAKPAEHSRPSLNPSIAIDSGPLLLHGGAWWKTRDWIGTYGDLEQRLAWKYLEQDLSSGHEFSHQLIPSIADDVFLHCRVVRKTGFETPAGKFYNALDVFYLIDYGVVSDGLPEFTYSRLIDYGNVVYAPNYGPVYCYERSLVYVGDDAFSPGYGDRTCYLLGSNLLED